MKKTATLIILLFIISISLVSIKNYIYVSGNTFTIPQDNKENNQYHTYNIENNKHKPSDKKTNNKNYNNSKSSSTEKPPVNKNYNNSTEPPVNKNYSNSTKTPVNKNHSNNTEPPVNKNYSNSTKTPTNKNYSNSTKTPVNKNHSNNTKTPVNKNKPASKPSHTPNVKATPAVKSSRFPDKQKTYTKKPEDTITKIEFQKHFIKMPAGDCENIVFTTIPAKAASLNFIYKSTNNSIATFKNKKLTGIKKGFTTILIMLPDGTIKAACPVKII